MRPSFKLPPETFVAGKRYTIRAQSVVGGFPGIANGDLRTKTLPISSAFLDSAVFQVVP